MTGSDRLSRVFLPVAAAVVWLASAVPAGAQPAPERDAAQDVITHVVVRGDTLGEISRSYGMTVSGVVALNPEISNPDLIFPGQRITVAGRASTEAPAGESGPLIYVVKPGDTLSRIAAAHGVTLGELLEVNPRPNPDLIFPGALIDIPGQPADPRESRVDPRSYVDDYERGATSAAPTATAPTIAATTGAGPTTAIPVDRDNTFDSSGVNGFVDAAVEPTSTFGLDVDTGSYGVGRRFVADGRWPPPESVRVEEYVNSFDYLIDAPGEGLALETFTAARQDGIVLVGVGVRATRVAFDELAPLTLTFVVDTSGSMDYGNRLGLVKASLAILAEELRPQDTISIVTFSTTAQVHLAPTPGAEYDTIIDAVDALGPTGSTNLEGGLRMGYGLASDHFDADGLNRVILLSDGVANVGVTGPGSLVELIRSDADHGISLTTIGYGLGNYNDALMEYVADQADGHYAYVDTYEEAERLFRTDLASTLITVAADAKAQITFDPAAVDEYRLVGYENRALTDDDFNDPTADSADIGSGRSVFALYEVRPAGDTPSPLGTATVRWRNPSISRTDATADVVQTIEANLDRAVTTLDDADLNLQLASVVADVADLLRGSGYVTDRGLTIDQLAERANEIAELVPSEQTRAFADFVGSLADLKSRE